MADSDLARLSPPSRFSSKDALYWLRSSVHANQEAASMEEGNKYKMAAHIKPGIGLLPGDEGIESLIRAATISCRHLPHRRPEGGWGLELPRVATPLSRCPVRRPRCASRGPGQGPAPLLPARTVAALFPPGQALVPSLTRDGRIQVSVRWWEGGLSAQAAYGSLFLLSCGVGRLHLHLAFFCVR